MSKQAPPAAIALVPAPALPAPAKEPRWTRARMADFLAELATSHSVAAAARAVGLSRQSAYRLRARLRGEAFDAAWEAAVQQGYDALHEAALERALHGVEMPVYHRGALVGARRQFDERLTMFLLSDRNRRAVRRGRDDGFASAIWAARLEELIGKVRRGEALFLAVDDEDEDPFGAGED